jgi:hypothetical protein
LVPQLRARGIDAHNVYDLRHQGWADASLLQSSAANGRLVVTHNIRDFVTLHHTYLARIINEHFCSIADRPPRQAFGRRARPSDLHRAIVPIHSTHSVIKPNPERLEHQRSRWSVLHGTRHNNRNGGPFRPSQTRQTSQEFSGNMPPHR